MFGMLGTWACAAILLGQAGPPIERVPDPSWSPRDGGTASIRADATIATTSAGALADSGSFVVPLGKGDQVVHLAGGTRVAVGRYMRPPSSSPTTAGSLEEFAGRAQAEALAHRAYPVEVKILDGDYEGQVRFVSEADLVKLVDKPIRVGLTKGRRATVVEPGVPFAVGETTIPLPRNTRLMGVADAGERYEVRVLPPSRLAGKVGHVPARDHRLRLDDARPGPRARE